MTDGYSDTWQIDHECPQCGAPVTLSESDRFLLCSYCRTKLYLVTDDHFRYCIPVENSTYRDMIYVPYWRMKGLSFSVLANDITRRFFDTNMCAMGTSGIPSSLGLRPQVLKLKFASPYVEGCFLDPDLDARTVMERLHLKIASCFHQAFIGEMTSIIYAPMYLEHNVLYDAILKKPVCCLEDEAMDGYGSKGHSQGWRIRFISTICPRCGWDLQGEKNALALMCMNCDSIWTCQKERFEEVPYSVVADEEPAPYYLPFWRMKPRIEGISLASYADLIRAANLPKVVTDAHENTPLYFWSPAFKINPSLFLRWSRQMTVAQLSSESADPLPRSILCPVTLSSSEAGKSIIVTIANLVRDKRGIYPALVEIRISLEETSLEYHPFTIDRNDIIHTKLRVSIDRNALAFGTQL